MNRTVVLTSALLATVFLSTPVRAQSGLEHLLDPSRLPYLKEGRHLQISSFDSTGGNDDRITLRNGETAVLADIEGPGVITRIWITINSPDPHFLRRIVLRMFWDDEVAPSVDVPVGDFFGTGFEYTPYASQLVGMTSGGYFSYFPMPFNERARIEVENQTGPHLPVPYYHINVQSADEPSPEDVAYFHASWRRELRTAREQNYLLLEAEGRGHVIGVNMSMQGYDGGISYLEGDEMIYVDGERHPSIYGTGTEDYFTSGWYFEQGPFSAPYHGLILKDEEKSRIAAYRLHVPDPISFRESIRFTMEHGHGNSAIADYSSTVYWYQKEPHRPFDPLPQASLRIPLRVTVPNRALEAESDEVRISGAEIEIEDMTPHGPDWSDLRQVRVRDAVPIMISLPAGENDRYFVDLYYTMGPEYGNSVVTFDGEPLDTLWGFSEVVQPGGRVHLGSLRADDGRIHIEVRPVDPHPAAEGRSLGLDAFVIEPDRKFIPEWYVIGPFPNPVSEDGRREGLDVVYPPEEEIDLSATYVGALGQPVSWKKTGLDPAGRLQLWGRFEPSDLITSYALTYVYSPRDQTVPLLLGSDDGVKVLFNDEAVHQREGIRIAAPDQDRVPLRMKQGWNKLMIKVENNFGGYSFFARLLDPVGELTVSADRSR